MRSIISSLSELSAFGRLRTSFLIALCASTTTGCAWVSRSQVVRLCRMSSSGAHLVIVCDWLRVLRVSVPVLEVSCEHASALCRGGHCWCARVSVLESVSGSRTEHGRQHETTRESFGARLGRGARAGGDGERAHRDGHAEGWH